MSDAVSPLLEWLNANPEWAGFVTFAISAAESVAIIGTIIPGSITMTAIGALAGAGVIPLWATIFWAILGAIVGDGISYWLGYYFKDRLRGMWPFRNNPSVLEQGEVFVHKYGVMSVFVGRFVGPVRALVPLVAGMLGMKPIQFTIANITSAIGWAPVYMFPGILLGAASLELPPDIALHVILALFLIILFIILCLWCVYKLCQLIHKQTNQLQNWIWRGLKKSRYSAPLTIILKREDMSKPHGQLTLAFYFCGIVFMLACLCWYVKIVGPTNVGINRIMYHFFRGISTINQSLTDIVINMTILGQKDVILPVFAFLCSWLFYRNRNRAAIHTLALATLAALSLFLMKHGLNIPRPWGIFQSPETRSMPSGHTAMSTVFFMGLAFLVASSLPIKLRWPVYILGAIAVLLVSTSRLYLGAHWFTDIAAGWLLGTAVLILIVISYRRETRKRVGAAGITTVSILALLLSASIYHYQNIDKLKMNYTQLNWPTVKINMAYWWQNNQAIPDYHVSLFGFPSQTINVEWVGDLNQIRNSLIKEGWDKPPARDWVSTLHRIADVRSTEYLPMVSPQYLDKRPILIFTRKTSENNGLLVLRLWEANRIIDGKGTPLLVGVIARVPRSYSWLFKKRLNEFILDPSLIFPRQKINREWEWKTITLIETMKSGAQVPQKIVLIRKK